MISNVLEYEDQTPIRNLDNTFVDHTSDYKTRLVYKDALKSISSKTGALFPRMNQFESQTSFLSDEGKKKKRCKVKIGNCAEHCITGPTR